MKTFGLVCVAALAAAVLGGCGGGEQAEAPASGQPSSAPKAAAVSRSVPVGPVKVGDKALCVICSVNEGTTEAEEVKQTLDYKGRTYAFCNESEKAEFISNPTKYADASK